MFSLSYLIFCSVFLFCRFILFLLISFFFFFFNDTATTEIYTLSLHDALPIWRRPGDERLAGGRPRDRARRDARAPLRRASHRLAGRPRGRAAPGARAGLRRPRRGAAPGGAPSVPADRPAVRGGGAPPGPRGPR